MHLFLLSTSGILVSCLSERWQKHNCPSSINTNHSRESRWLPEAASFLRQSPWPPDCPTGLEAAIVRWWSSGMANSSTTEWFGVGRYTKERKCQFFAHSNLPLPKLLLLALTVAQLATKYRTLLKSGHASSTPLHCEPLRKLQRSGNWSACEQHRELLDDHKEKAEKDAWNDGWNVS